VAQGAPRSGVGESLGRELDDVRLALGPGAHKLGDASLEDGVLREVPVVGRLLAGVEKLVV
jgi:hypothetical protein